MSTRYTADEVRSIVDQITIEAKMAGLIDMDSMLVYSPGNASNGISGMVDCYRTVRTEHGRSHREYVRVDFLPEFNHTQTKTDHAKLLIATLRVFYGFRRHREAADKL